MLYQRIPDTDVLGNNIRYYNNLGFPWLHMHRQTELLIVEHGDVMLTINGRTEMLHAGDTALVLPYQLHSFVVDNSAGFWVHVFEHKSVPMFFFALGSRQSQTAKFHLHTDTLAYYRAVCLRLPPWVPDHASTASEAMGKLSPIKLASALYAVLSDYLSYAELIEGEKTEEFLYSRIMMYIAEHFAEDITLISVAAEFGYEPHYLSRYMTKIVNINFRQLINQCRIDYARHLLESTTKDVTEIALASGYGCTRTFHRAFREIVGTTPGEYRKMSSSIQG